MKRLVPELGDYEFENDLYGLKDAEVIRTPFVLTSKSTSKAVKAYRRALKPHEMNIILNLAGDDLVLCKVEDMEPVKNRYEKEISDFKYYYRRYFVNWKTRIYFYFSQMKYKLKIRG